MRRLRVLHLAFEDPHQPGSGGGAIRTQELNKRLAERLDITVVTAGWSGAGDRVEDGVRWTHTPALPGRARALAYFARLPAIVRKAEFDLLVEDFAAPASTFGLPRLTSRPVVGVVQWLFAKQKAAQYHLPLEQLESWGLRQHRDLIAVSEGLAQQLRRRAPQARVTVVENGLRQEDRPNVDMTRCASREGILFLGRVELAQKGLDVLLDAFALLADLDTTLTVVGDGPDEARLRALAERRGVDARVRWLGRVEGLEKTRLLGAAAVVAIPSRYETFGMVAAEAMAAGTAVVASDIPCLRDVVDGAAGLIVPADDAPSLAGALRRVLSSADLAATMGARGVEASKRFDWDVLAPMQEDIYRDVVGRQQAAQ